MTYITVLVALAIGYAIGTMQGGVKIYQYRDYHETPGDEGYVGYNKSTGIDEFMEYYEDTGGANKF